MIRQAEKAAALLAVLDRYQDEVSLAWVERVHHLPDSHYSKLPLDELEMLARRGLQSLMGALSSGSYVELESRLVDLTLTRLQRGCNLGELVEAILLVKEATLPFIRQFFSPDSVEAEAAIKQLEAGLCYILSRFGYLYAEAMHRLHQQQRAAPLLQVAQTASSSLELDQVLKLVAGGIAAAVGVHHCGIFLVEEEQDGLVLRTSTESPANARFDLVRNRPLNPQTHRLVHQVVERREPVTCYDAQTDNRVDREVVRALGLKSVLAVPMEVGDRALGAVIVGTLAAPHAFTAKEIELVRGIAKLVGLVVENTRLYEEMGQRLAESQSLQRVTAAFLQKLGLEQVLEIVCFEARALLGGTESAVCLLNTGHETCLRVALTRETPTPTFERMLTGDWIADRVICRGEPVLDNNPAEEVLGHCGTIRPTALLAVPLRVDRTIIGALNVLNKPGGFTEEDLRLISLLADQAAIAIENARLHQQAEQLAVLKERKWVARELHDSITQALYTVTLYAEAAVTMLRAGNTVGVVDHLRELRDAAREALREMRLLIFELRPPVLAEEGLVGALQARLEMVEARAGFQTELRVSGEKRLPLTVEEELYRIAQEALNNAVKHAQARRVTVELQFTDDTISMEVSDDGVGFDSTSANEKGGWGLRGMTERAQRIGGQLTVESVPRQGTRVRFKLKTQGFEEEPGQPRGIQPLSQLFPGPPSVDQVPSVAQPPIRVLVVDDHVIVRQGLRALLTAQADIEVVGEAGSGVEAVTQAAVLRPQVILMDLVMPELDGIEAIRQITARQPEIRLLVLTSFSSDDKVFPALKAGALGYLLKDSSPEELVQAIRQVYRGESSLHPAIARKVLRELVHPSQPPSSAGGLLSEREVAVLCLVAQGRTNHQIAEELVVTETTVRSHVSHILHKLHLVNRTQAVLYALQQGLALPDIPPGANSTEG